MIRKVLFLGISREVRSELPYCESTTESVRPDSDALIGLFLKTALASAWAAFGLTVLPSRSLACMRYVSTAR